jgi:hypothetical protein
MSFNGSGKNNGVFNFISPKKLVSIEAYNGGQGSSTITLSCSGNPTKTESVVVGQIVKITTGWSAPCTAITLTSTNGWDTNFDNFVYDSGSTSNNQLPTGSITGPANGTLYKAGDTVAYSGSASDTEDGSLSAGAFSWTIVFHHDTHTHPFLGPITGSSSGSFTVPTIGETSSNVWYRIHLTVTDSVGGQQTSYVDILPTKANFTLQTSPSGLQVTLDGQPKTTPYTGTGVVGFTRTLGVVSPQTFGGNSYQFSSWSDNGAASHSFSTPNTNTTYTATYQTAAVTPTPTPTQTPTATPTPTPTPSGGSQTITFNDLTVSGWRNLNGQYPTGVINWGNNLFTIASPWGAFTTNSLSLTPSRKSSAFTFVSAKKLVSLEAYNGGGGASTITLSCTGNSTKSQSVPANTKVTITTGWTNTCTSVTIGSSNGWDTNYDNLIIQ